MILKTEFHFTKNIPGISSTNLLIFFMQCIKDFIHSIISLNTRFVEVEAACDVCVEKCIEALHFCCPQVTSLRMQGLLLILFAKQVHLPFIRDIQSTYTRTGLFGYWVWYSLYILTFHKHFLLYTDFLLIPMIFLQN